MGFGIETVRHLWRAVVRRAAEPREQIGGCGAPEVNEEERSATGVGREQTQDTHASQGTGVILDLTGVRLDLTGVRLDLTGLRLDLTGVRLDLTGVASARKGRVEIGRTVRGVCIAAVPPLIGETQIICFNISVNHS